MHLRQKICKLYNTGALHITIGTFATKFVAFFGSIVVVRLLSKQDYGLMSYVENFYSYAFIFASMGLSNAILRYLVIAKDKFEKEQYFHYIIKKSIFVNIGISIILIIFSQIITIPDNYSGASYLIPIVALLLPFQDLLNEILYVIRTFFKNKLYAYAAFVSSSFLIIGRLIGAYTHGVDGVLWSRVLINIFFVFIGLIYVRKKYFMLKQVEVLPKEKRKAVSLYSLQYMITNGFWALFMLNDTFLLGLLLNDPISLADYKVAYVLPGNISIFATAIGVFVGPYFTKNEKNIGWIQKNFKLVYFISAIVVAGASIVIAIFAKPLIYLMYGEQYLNVVLLMRVLLLAAFINSGLRYTTANLLAAMGEIKYNMIISGVGIISQVLLDILLIPKMGAMAVAVSNCIVYFIMSVFLFVVFWNKYYRKYKR